MAILPVLACALCPACLSTYAKVLAVLGIGFGVSELQHDVVLCIAIGLALVSSAWRAVRTRNVWPFALTLVGSALVASGHLAGDLPALEWAGVLTLLAGTVFEHFRTRHPRFSVAPLAVERAHGE